MPRYLLSVCGPAERNELGDQPTKEGALRGSGGTAALKETLAAEGSRACRGNVEVRPFQTEGPFQALLKS